MLQRQTVVFHVKTHTQTCGLQLPCPQLLLTAAVKCWVCSLHADIDVSVRLQDQDVGVKQAPSNEPASAPWRFENVCIHTIEHVDAPHGESTRGSYL